MVNKFIHYQLLDEREEQLINKAGAESFTLFIGLVLLSYLVAVLAPSLFNPNFLVYTLIVGIFFFFNRARYLGVTYYSRVSFYDFRLFFPNLGYYGAFDVAELSIQHRNLSAQSFER